ncbi:hypothetical protein TRFO_28810 [Tritrichomonas foetus]|uniref:Uncharacterized protein n=1 Tax=Tritrichomonas foetus TaxID=1144522 RepID=A0A1J4K2G6_9EUKA|nr:hypothetical protein TRFO_28810 [Tritrichomonas foetus]|eukprot:OHT03685.1 hypothetical protein TRFO_28810 [Tritrichomonas foetus]
MSLQRNSIRGKKPLPRQKIAFQFSSDESSSSYDESSIELLTNKKDASSLYSYSSSESDSSKYSSSSNSGLKSNDKLFHIDDKSEKQNHSNNQNHPSHFPNKNTAKNVNNENEKEVQKIGGKYKIPKIESEPAISHVPPVQTSTLRMLDRYRIQTPRALSNFKIPAMSARVMNYTLFRKTVWKKSAKKKYFQLTDSGNVLAGAQYSSSKVIEISNNHGLIAEVDIVSKKGPFILRIGDEEKLEIVSGAGRSITVNFVIEEDSKFPYTKLISPPNACDDVTKAFGSRHAIQSVKNCKLCKENQKDEVVAVRKTKNNVLSIDALQEIPLIYCMAIGLFMFISKP